MSIFQQDFGQSSTATPASAGAAGSHHFSPLNFRHRNYCGLAEGDYKVVFTDGSVSTVRASSALEAMEQAVRQGPVLKVERATLKRVRLLGSDLVQDRESEPKADPLIKPGTILVSFDTMSKFIHQQQASAMQAEVAMGEEAVAAFAAPLDTADMPDAEGGESLVASDWPAEGLAEPVQPAAETQPTETPGANALPASGERPLTEDEVDKLLNTPPEA